MKRKRTIQIILLILALEIFSMLVIPEQSSSAPAYSYYAGDLQFPLVIAHQGGNGLWPGNTLYAFKEAVKLGADAIETDIQLSKDGVLVLMHDHHLNYTTDGSGLLENRTVAELKKLDAGYKWSSDGGKSYPFRGKDISVPTLEEAFQALPQTRFVLDVKRTRTHIEKQLCELIRQYNRTAQVVVASVDDDIVKQFRETCPEVATSAAFGEVTAFVFAEKGHLSGWVYPAYESLQGPFDPSGLYDDLVITANYVRDAHVRTVRIEPWANDRQVMKYYIDLGVDGVITDYPDILLELICRK
jgi:glycerophosphoryl diester phosphodiesterase